jgi:hypothetical protein
MILLAIVAQDVARGASGESPSRIPFALGHALTDAAWRYGDETILFVRCSSPRRCVVTFGRPNGRERKERFAVRRLERMGGCRVFEDYSGKCYGLHFWSIDR